MIRNIKISNFALIENIKIDFEPNLNILTGETGSGKSIIISALGMLMGERFEKKALYNPDEKCIVEAEIYLLPEIWAHRFKDIDVDFFENSIFRREILPNGRSRSFINDTPVLSNQLRKFRSELIDIHEQDHVQKLNDKQFQIDLIDSYGSLLNKSSVFYNDYSLWQNSLKQLNELKQSFHNTKKEKDYISFLHNELNEVDLNIDIKVLEDDLAILEKAEEIKHNLKQFIFETGEKDNSIIQQLEQNIESIGLLSDKARFKTICERLDSILIELKDIQRDIELEESHIEINPDKLDEIETQINQTNKLLNKHNLNNLADLKSLKEELAEKLKWQSNTKNEIEVLESKIVIQEKELFESAKTLSSKRRKVIIGLEKKINQLLKEVGIPYGKISINTSSQSPPILTKHGIDHIQILFSPDNGNKFLPLSKVASGGELSRIMLCFKVILSEKTHLPIIVMDEIDTGVSGEVAQKVGKVINTLSANNQVICITHLPQIACKGQTHFYVFKKTTNNSLKKSHIKRLNQKERLHELAVMLSGDNPSSSAIANAQELLNT
jgi:DNA repair protein RecN (Recombination protein N)